MGYVFSIGEIIAFVKRNKEKVMMMPKEDRMDVMYDLIHIAGLDDEFLNRCCDELEDTEYEIAAILECS